MIITVRFTEKITHLFNVIFRLQKHDFWILGKNNHIYNRLAFKNSPSLRKKSPSSNHSISISRQLTFVFVYF